MEKVHLIAWALLIMFLTASAGTAYFNNREDALAELNKPDPQTFQAGDCKVQDVTEIIHTGQTKGEIVVDYSFTYNYGGQQRNEPLDMTVPNTDPKEIEGAVAAECDKQWAYLKNQAENQKITAVQINYTDGALSTLRDKVYDVVTKQWS